MSVLKAKRKSSQFEVFHHFYKTRKEITDLLLRDFGYDLERAEKRVAKMFGGRNYEELTPEEKVRYDKLKAKNEAFDNWFIEDERKCIVQFSILCSITASTNRFSQAKNSWESTSTSETKWRKPLVSSIP